LRILNIYKDILSLKEIRIKHFREMWNKTIE